MSTLRITGAEISTMTPDQFIDYLDSRIATLLVDIEMSEMWRTLTSSQTDPRLVQTVMREIYLEIFSYQPHVIEAAIATIGQMPRTLDPRQVRSMLIHQAEEFDHGEMALRDYIALGGDEQFARTRRSSPAAFAVSAVWWMIARINDPFAYLGALYPFEGLTPIVTERVKPFLTAKGMGQEALNFVEFHSTEDPKHTNLVRHLIKQVITQYPSAMDSMKHGLDYFLAVYPMPVWNEAYHRARAEFGL